LLNDNKPIRSNTHELATLLAQHVRRMKIRTQCPVFGLNKFSRTSCVSKSCGPTLSVIQLHLLSQLILVACNRSIVITIGIGL